jgi:bifunctional non-homologous end joining protein LigD
MTAINGSPKAVSLFCTEGSADKAYQVSIAAKGGGWVVEFAYGKRGTALKTGTKTQSPVGYAEAVKIFDKLLKEKTSKGYTEDESGIGYTNTEHAHLVSGVLPQLPTAIDPSELERLLSDPIWGLQEKMDGENRLIQVKGGVVRGINRKGFFVDIPQDWATSFAVFPDCLIAGEAIGAKFHAFDLLECDGSDLRSTSFKNRYELLSEMLGDVLLKMEIGTAEFFNFAGAYYLVTLERHHIYKRSRVESVQSERGEGVVFKRLDAAFETGKCLSSLKHKFVESATCIVLRQNQQRSVAVGLRDGDVMLDLGNVTIPANFAVPEVGVLVEVRYLYRFENGCFEQPVYLGMRTDIDEEEAVVSQITRIKTKSASVA